MSEHTTLKVRRDLHKKLKIAAIHEGVNLEDYASALLEGALGAIATPAPAASRTEVKAPALAKRKAA